MSRWGPDGRSRLEQAALELYAERGYENTTVAEIAERAGVTERTFFRHFADKREALFSGSSALQELMTRAVANAPASFAPIDAVVAGIEAAGAQFQEYSAVVRKRASIIAATPELRERELIKLASLSAALAETLRGRGVSEPAARLTAEVGVAIFSFAFERWVADTNARHYALFVREALDQLKAMT